MRSGTSSIKDKVSCKVIIKFFPKVFSKIRHNSSSSKRYEKYNWDGDKFDRLYENDIFIYRRPQNASEISGQFYFFGAGKMGQIKSIGGVRVQGKIEKPYLFKDKLFKDDLSNYKLIDNEDRSELEVVLYQQQQRGNYYVDDQSGNDKV
jgi:hypothetical protein